MRERASHLIRAATTFFLIIVSAGLLLPLVRSRPEALHEYLNGLSDWIRVSFSFSLALIFTVLTLKLLSPHIRQLEHWKTHPPTWLAVLLASTVVAIIDLCGGFDPTGYRPNIWEWLGYGGIPLVMASWYFGLWTEITQWLCQVQQPASEERAVTLEDLERAPWEEIDTWLSSDAPAKYDFIGHQSVAHRVSLLIADGIRSVGIVGPFGAGKTSIVNWVADRLSASQVAGTSYFLCHHSCWGFETPESAIRDMLASAISKLSTKIDTFQVDSLPESYRRTFSAGGDWIETISRLALRSAEPMEQFAWLSKLLGDIRGRLVFIVEDLDRNRTRSFEIQGVLAFLERLKKFPNISFVLTGGLSSSNRIDYSKLCDHVEFLRTIEPSHTASLMERVTQRCLDNAVFPSVRLDDTGRSTAWGRLSGMLLRDFEEFSRPQAAAMLLNTPRSFRHALGRTFAAWHTLHGEIDFDHLLGVNILRFGAPECFQFLLRRWDRLHSPPSDRQSAGKGSGGIRGAILADWNRTIQNVEWNPAAALQVMKFILPATEYWLIDHTRQGHFLSGYQQVWEERYWARAVNEAIDRDDVRDQEVLRDTEVWLATPSMATDLVTNLISSSRYSDTWLNLANRQFAKQRVEALLLCEHVLKRILDLQGSSAGPDSQGFEHTWIFAIRQVGNRPEGLDWLKERISEAAEISIEMAKGLWHHYGSPGRYAVLRQEDSEPARRHLIDAVRTNVTDGRTLAERLSPKTANTLFQLVFDPGADEKTILADVPSWSWLGPHILAGLRSRNALAASNCGVLLGARVSGHKRVSVDAEVLEGFFGHDKREVIEILDSMIEHLPERERGFVRNVVGAARQHLDGDILPNDHAEEADTA